MTTVSIYSRLGHKNNKKNHEFSNTYANREKYKPLGFIESEHASFATGAMDRS